jgi:hypothetical protein
MRYEHHRLAAMDFPVLFHIERLPDLGTSESNHRTKVRRPRNQPKSFSPG